MAYLYIYISPGFTWHPQCTFFHTQVALFHGNFPIQLDWKFSLLWKLLWIFQLEILFETQFPGMMPENVPNDKGYVLLNLHVASLSLFINCQFANQDVTIFIHLFNIHQTSYSLNSMNVLAGMCLRVTTRCRGCLWILWPGTESRVCHCTSSSCCKCTTAWPVWCDVTPTHKIIKEKQQSCD